MAQTRGIRIYPVPRRLVTQSRETCSSKLEEIGTDPSADFQFHRLPVQPVDQVRSCPLSTGGLPCNKS